MCYSLPVSMVTISNCQIWALVTTVMTCLPGAETAVLQAVVSVVVHCEQVLASVHSPQP